MQKAIKGQGILHYVLFCLLQFLQLSAIVDEELSKELPSGWMEVSHAQQKRYCVISYQKADECAPLVVTRFLVIDKTGEWQLHINGHLVDISVVPLLVSFPKVLPEFDAFKLMTIVNDLNKCVGNSDPKFVTLGKQKRTDIFYQ